MHENVIICLDGGESNIGTEQVGSGFFTREGLISGCSSKFDGWRRVRRVFSPDEANGTGDRWKCG